jgi:hypothetical protein
MKLGLAEILKKTSEFEKKQDRMEYLNKWDSAALRALLKYAYDPKVKFLLPEGAPPYKANDLPDLQNVLYSELRKLYLFIEGGNPSLKQTRREYLFVQMLENLDKEDAELLLAVKDKKIPYKGITKKFVEEMFPGLLEG